MAKVQRFAAHLGLAFVDLGILPEPHDADVPADLFPLQVSSVLPLKGFSFIPAASSENVQTADHAGPLKQV